MEKRVKVLCEATSYSAAIGFWKETELCKATHLSDLPDHPMVTSQQRLSAEAAMLLALLLSSVREQRMDMREGSGLTAAPCT